MEPKIFTVFVKARKIEVSDVETKYHVNILREIIGACGQVSLIPKDTCSPEEYNTACDVFIELYQQLMQALSVERFWLKSGSSAIIALKKVREMRRQFPVLLEEGEDLTNWYLYGEKQHLEEALKFLENEKVEIKRE